MVTNQVLPGEGLQIHKMPGHWVLARSGKRVLRPGGIALTRAMLNDLHIESCDSVVEFAPGLGITAKMTLSCQPASYVAIERDAAAADSLRKNLPGDNVQIRNGVAEETGLPDQCATVIYGEAMLSMQTQANKQRIATEVARLLKTGGRYGLHELCFVPDWLDYARREDMESALSNAIHVGARPLTVGEWRYLLTSAGLTVKTEALAPMSLLEPRRIVQDEGVWRALQFATHIMLHREARRRVLAMRRAFRKCRPNLMAVVLTAAKE